MKAFSADVPPRRRGCSYWKDADVVLIDACAGDSQSDVLSALRNGDVPTVAAVFSNGIPRFVGRSRNTPASMRNVRVAENRLSRDFSGVPD
jgi:enamidase